MARKESHTTRIARLTSKRFPSLSTVGTGVEELVRFVLAKKNALESAQRQKIGNDAKDVSFTAGLLEPMSSLALGTIQNLKQREVRQRLTNKARPFSRLSKATREKLLYLPISWVREGALWQLSLRKPGQSNSDRKT